MNEILTEFCNYLGEKGYYKFVDSNAVINDFIKSLQYQNSKKNHKPFPKLLNFPDEGNINISFFALEKVISTAVELGIDRYLIEQGDKKAFLSQAAAYKKYGKRTIDRWRSNGNIEPICQNHRIKYNIVDLDRLSKTNEIFFKFIEDI